MHAFLQITLFAGLVLVWLLLDRIKQKRRERLRSVNRESGLGRSSNDS